MAEPKEDQPRGRPLRIHAVPWKTSTEQKIKGALGEVPAYIRRARRMEEAVERLYVEVAEVREGFLEFTCLRLRELLDVMSEDYGRRLPEETVRALGVILDAVDEHPSILKLMARPRPPHDRREPESALALLRKSVDRFNTRFSRWLTEEAPLDAVNEEIRGYNKHYSFERQCALRFVPLDKVMFEPRAPLTEMDLLTRFPLLPRP